MDLHRQNIAIVYATKYGQTEKIARRIREILVDRGIRVELFRIDNRHSAADDLERFDAVIIGGAIEIGKFPKQLLRWVKDRADDLNAKPIFLFSVSLNAADMREKARIVDEQLLGTFLTETDVRPTMARSLIGGVPYTKYNFLVRFMMKRICEANHGPTDTTRDHELTDWNAVEEFALATIASIPQPSSPNLSVAASQ